MKNNYMEMIQGRSLDSRHIKNIFILSALGLVVCSFPDLISGLGLMPLMLGPCSSGSGGSGSGNCAGSNSGGCDWGGGGGSGSSGGGSSSTPFLYTKDRKGRWIMHNDVMVGYPSTFVCDREKGEQDYFNNRMGFDNYPFDVKDFNNKGYLNIRIKEIEPEESYIYLMRLHSFVVDSNDLLVQGWNHQDLFSIKPESIRAIESSIILNSNHECTDQLKELASKGDVQKDECVRLERGDTLNFTLDRQDDVEYMTIESLWREWTPGTKKRISTLNFKKNNWRTRLLVPLVSVAAFFGFLFTRDISSVGTQGEIMERKDLDFLQRYLGANEASADTSSKSLNFSYLHPLLKTWVHYATVQPRVKEAKSILVDIPSEAYDSNDKVQIQVMATQTHHIKSINVVSGVPKKQSPVQTQNITDVIHNTRSLPIRSGDSKDPLAHIVPGDALEFKIPIDDSVTHASLEIRGFYTPLSVEGQERAGDWTRKLTTEEEDLVSNIFDLSKYRIEA